MTKKYDIQTSTLHDHVTGKVKRGPPPVLRHCEEEQLANWIMEMSRIWYGQCRRQVCLMVKKILDHDGRANPFPDNLAVHPHHAGHPY